MIFLFLNWFLWFSQFDFLESGFFNTPEVVLCNTRTNKHDQNAETSMIAREFLHCQVGQRLTLSCQAP
jgi:hypothetical protein